MIFGLLDQDLDYIIKAIRQHTEIEKVKIFSSRAMGNYKKGSDVDIAILGKDINEKIVAQLSDILNEEYPLPYFVKNNSVSLRNHGREKPYSNRIKE